MGDEACGGGGDLGAHSPALCLTQLTHSQPCIPLSLRHPPQVYRFRCRLTRALGAIMREARAFQQEHEAQAALAESDVAALQPRVLLLLEQAGLWGGGGDGARGAEAAGGSAAAAEAEAAAAAAALGLGPHLLADFLALLLEGPDMGADLDREEQGKASVGGF